MREVEDHVCLFVYVHLHMCVCIGPGGNLPAIYKP